MQQHTLLLSSAYLPPVSYFALLYAAPRVVVDVHEHYVKQTYRSRCVIAAADGRQALTLPIERIGNNTPIHEIHLSEHGNWRHLHWNALVSAYENSPYFEYYADDFKKFYETRSIDCLVDFNKALTELLCNELQLSPNIEYSDAYVEANEDFLDFRNVITPKKTSIDAFVPQPYWQVFAQRNGFLSDLSMVDLLFNMGPESRIILKNSVR